MKNHVSRWKLHVSVGGCVCVCEGVGVGGMDMVIRVDTRKAFVHLKLLCKKARGQGSEGVSRTKTAHTWTHAGLCVLAGVPFEWPWVLSLSFLSSQQSAPLLCAGWVFLRRSLFRSLTPFVLSSFPSSLISLPPPNSPLLLCSSLDQFL